MTENNVLTTSTLREKLFDSIDRVKDGTMSPAQAKEVASVGRVIIESARLELDHVNVLAKLDGGDSGLSPGHIVLGNKPALEYKEE